MNKQVGAVSWQAGGESSSTETKKIPFLNMKKGNTTYKLRIVDDQPLMYHCHWVVNSQGSRVKVNCTLDNTCPVVDDQTQARCGGKTAQTRYYVKVIDRSDSQIKVLDMGPQIYKAIAGYATDEDWGHPSGYDISIKKGNPGDNPLYVVMPSPKAAGPLSQEEQQMVTDSETSDHENFIDLESRIQPLTADTINKILTGDNSNDSGSKPRAGRTAPESTTTDSDLTEDIDEDDLINWED